MHLPLEKQSQIVSHHIQNSGITLSIELKTLKMKKNISCSLTNLLQSLQWNSFCKQYNEENYTLLVEKIITNPVVKNVLQTVYNDQKYTFQIEKFIMNIQLIY